MLARLAYVFLLEPSKCDELVEKSYDRISTGYDQIWTRDMRDLTASLIKRIEIKEGDTAIDLTCGTGYATKLIAEKTNGKVIGVDTSEGMIEQAREQYGQCCDFIKSDVLQYLRELPDESIDLVTCCWGIGYSKPFAVLRQIRRVLRPRGKVAIIDNSLFSIREVLYCSFLTFLEQPEKLINLMRFRFMMGSWHLYVLFKMLNMKALYLSSGSKSYTVETGKEAIERLIR
jgi:ubiquinone/menaquinone biosynthesis C-methylase UbiE